MFPPRYNENTMSVVTTPQQRAREIDATKGTTVRNRTLTLSRGRMTLGVEAIFWFISHTTTMSCPPRD
jgi:hypothetical protein